MATKKKALQAAAGAAGGDLLAIEDVFSTYLYTGNGSSQTITNGIDLAGEGGLVWIKPRVLSDRHLFVDTERGSDRVLASNNTNAEIIATNPSFQPIESFNSNGFTVGAFNDANDSGDPHASWTFRKAPRFFDVVTFSVVTDFSEVVVDHNLGVIPGCIIVKRLDSTSDWYVYNIASGVSTSVTGLSLNATTSANRTNWNNSSYITDTTFSNFGIYDDGGNRPYRTGDYVAYLFAHDPLGPSGDGSDGLIACGSALGGSNFVDLGWEPQWILMKTTATGSWRLVDSMRGLTADGGNATLFADLSNAEFSLSSGFVKTYATGFSAEGAVASDETYIYIAIRRGPMRQPTSGTEVYSAGVVQNNTGRTLTNPLGYPSDMAFTQTSAGGDWIWQSRLTGTSGLFSNKTNAESTFYGYGFGNNTNYEADGTAVIGAYGWNFRRAPGFFDTTCYIGDGVAGRTVPHNLGVAPEMMIVKKRDGVDSWRVYHSGLNGGTTPQYYFVNLNNTNAEVANSAFWNNTAPASTEFTVGTNVNGSGAYYIAYLFATLPGVSKVGNYTGDGTNGQIINCGFTSGARFVLIKRTDSTGAWYVYDSARGIVSGNDPRLQLQDTAAEATGVDEVDPHSSGFIVNNDPVNYSGASYIFLAIA